MSTDRPADRLWRFGDPSAPVPLFWLVAAVLLAAQLVRPLHDVDAFWQVRLGDLTLDGGLPRTEPFLAGREGEPLAPIAWLGQAVFAAVRRVGGWTLLRGFDAVVWFAGFVVVARQASRGVGNDLPATVALLAGWLAAVPMASLRPQSFVVLGFGLLVALVRGNRPVLPTVLLGAALLVAWQNLHPSAVVGAGYLAAYAAGGWGWYLLRGGPRPSVAPVLLVPVAVAATLATPAGFDVYRVSAENTDRSVWLGTREWLPVWDGFPEGGRGQLALVLATTLGLFAWRGRRVAAADLLSVLALSVMAVLAVRFAVFFGVALIPVWVRCLTPPGDPDPVPSSGRRRWVAVGLMAAAALVPLMALGPNFAPIYPFAAADALAATGVRGPVYCHLPFGGLVADTGYPDRRPTFDGRYYLFSRDELSVYLAAARGEVPVDELDRRYHPAAFLLRPGPDDGLIGRLRASAGWTEVFADPAGVVFVRTP